MLNTILTIKLNLLLAIFLSVAAVSGTLTYAATQMLLVPATSSASNVCPPCPAATPAEKSATKRYFKIHKPKLNGEGF